MRQTFSPAKCAVLKFAAQIFRMQQSELVPHIHPFAAACGADSSSSDLHSGKSNFRARFLPSHRFLCNDWLSPRRLTPLWNGLVRTAPVEWFSLSLAPKPALRRASVTVHRIAYFIFHIRRRHAPHRYYTRPGAKMQALSALPQIFCRTVKSRHAQALTNRVPAS